MGGEGRGGECKGKMRGKGGECKGNGRGMKVEEKRRRGNPLFIDTLAKLK